MQTHRLLHAALLLGFISPCFRAADTPLNLLVIQTDEHHLKTLGCYGGKIVKTPNIDWIADHGARCTRFYATTPVCSPSRAALVSGRYPQNTPVTTNNIPLGDDVVTFAEVLLRQGYSTGYSGKWHLDGKGKPQWAPKRKFGFSDNRFMFNRGHWKKLKDTLNGPRVDSKNKRGLPDYGIEGANEKNFTTDWLTSKTIDFLNSNKDKPFCYMVSLPDPHGPNRVRPPYDTMFEKVEVPIPASINKSRAQTPKWAVLDPKITADTVRLLMPQYYGMVKCIDDNVGLILEALRRNNQLGRTVVVFTSDHSDLCGEHGRLNKGVPYEGSARIPFLLHCPGQVPAGTVVEEVLSCVDFLPTVFRLMNVDIPVEIEGRDASALFTGGRVAWNNIAFLRSTGTRDPWLCAVGGDYKLVFSGRDRPWLFDLKNDPDELRNRYGDAANVGIVRRLARELTDYCHRYNDPYGSHPKIRQDLAGAGKSE